LRDVSGAGAAGSTPVSPFQRRFRARTCIGDRVLPQALDREVPLGGPAASARGRTRANLKKTDKAVATHTQTVQARLQASLSTSTPRQAALRSRLDAVQKMECALVVLKRRPVLPIRKHPFRIEALEETLTLFLGPP
jgi:hypothetical protein